MSIEVAAPSPLHESQTEYENGPSLAKENTNESLFLFTSATLGVILNVVVIVSILLSSSMQREASAFILHGCIVDAVKSVYCFPFGNSLLKDVVPGLCSVLGGSYVIFVTASGFNIVAMICSEAFTFSQRPLEPHPKEHIVSTSPWCVIFGILMVYVGSVIIQLGPTIIGGDFNYNELIGNCIFSYGTVKSYVAHAMWMAIMTLAMTGAIYYLVYFHRHVQSSARVQPLTGMTYADNQQARLAVRDSLCRARVLILITSLFIFCWYPLHLLTLVDPKFHLSIKIYKLLTFIAWSNGALNPFVLLLFDNRLSRHSRHLFLRVVYCGRYRTNSTRNDGNRLDSMSAPRSDPIGTRLMHAPFDSE